jgi:hypothetical protein
MIFNEQVKPISNKPELIPPSKWHFIYWLKWQFVVKPKLMKAISKAKAEAADEILRSQLLVAKRPERWDK